MQVLYPLLYPITQLPTHKNNGKGQTMAEKASKFSELIKEVRKQLGLSQEDVARELGVSFATINRWENAKTVPFRLARNQFDMFCTKMIEQGKLTLPRGEE